jgi:general secretion pathway protein G
MVMAIILALSLMVIPMYTQVVSRARVARSVGEIRTIEKAINAYYLDNGNQYPPNLTAVGYGALLDPWGNPYVYHKVPAYVDIDTLPLNTDYDLYSQGEDGASGEDLMNFPNCLNDVIRAGNGAIVELARNH